MKLIGLNLIRVVLRLLRIITRFFPRNRKYILFLGHNGNNSGNAVLLYKYYLEKGVENLVLLNSTHSKWQIIKFFWNSKKVFISTPGKFWLLRYLRADNSKVYLLSNGMTLKAPGRLSQNFNEYKWNKYSVKWLDIDEFHATGSLERYFVAASIPFPIEKIRTNGTMREVYIKEQDRVICRNKILELLNLEDRDQQICLTALTQRQYLSNWSSSDAITSICTFEKLDNICVNNNTLFLIRDHSLASESETLHLRNIILFNSDMIEDINDVISGFDKIITDYSGVFMECLNYDHMQFAFLHVSHLDFVRERGTLLEDSFYRFLPTLRSMEDLTNFILTKNQDIHYSIKRKYVNGLFYNNSVDDILEYYNKLTIKI